MNSITSAMFDEKIGHCECWDNKIHAHTKHTTVPLLIINFDFHHSITHISLLHTDKIYCNNCLFLYFYTLYIHCTMYTNNDIHFPISAHREMRTTTNYFLLNLSVADLLMSSLNCMFNFIYMLNSDWPFGSVYCSLNNFLGNVTVSASVFTLVAISFNRYVIDIKHTHAHAHAHAHAHNETFVLSFYNLFSLVSMMSKFLLLISAKKKTLSQQ